MKKKARFNRKDEEPFHPEDGYESQEKKLHFHDLQHEANFVPLSRSNTRKVNRHGFKKKIKGNPKI